MHLDYIKKILQDNRATSQVFQRNLIKDYLQVVVLSYIYSHDIYRDLIFYGGSSLRHCYELERLSEDLDFVDIRKAVDLSQMSKDFISFFDKELKLPIVCKCQKFRLYLKIPLLHKLGLASISESRLLYLKVEVFKEFAFREFTVKIIPLFKYDRSMLIKTFDLPTLMATKINAILHRKWERTSKEGKILATVKGRDYYDLLWYLQKKVTPNIACISGIKTIKELKSVLLDNLHKVDPKSIELDLGAFVKDETFVKNLSHDIIKILADQIEGGLIDEQ